MSRCEKTASRAVRWIGGIEPPAQLLGTGIVRGPEARSACRSLLLEGPGAYLVELTSGS